MGRRTLTDDFNYFYVILLIGFGLCKLKILEIVKNYLVQIGKSHLFSDGQPTDTWYLRFLSRHYNITTRLACTMQSLRATMTQPEVFDSWFKKVKEEGGFKQEHARSGFEQSGLFPLCREKITLS